ncbi:MAG: outer membrane lipoprotein carrier protein LolA [Desulfobacteraceae bacterium]
MRRLRWIICLMMLAMALGTGVLSASADTSDAGLEKILKGIEARYAGNGFSAVFFQESMLKAMQISDTAEGRLTVKKPGKMRWEYTLPDPQTIITDGKSMWIHRPVDNQVMVGRAPEFFGDGKGAGFLSDIRQIRKSFRITRKPEENGDYLLLQLIPKKPAPEIAEIILSVGKETFQVDQVVTYNAYGDETKITLSDYQFGLEPLDKLFDFEIPKGADVVEIDQ